MPMTSALGLHGHSVINCRSSKDDTYLVRKPRFLQFMKCNISSGERGEISVRHLRQDLYL